jgi:hypothetical protein
MHGARSLIKRRTAHDRIFRERFCGRVIQIGVAAAREATESVFFRKDDALRPDTATPISDDRTD